MFARDTRIQNLKLDTVLLSADLRLDDLDEEQDVVSGFGQEGHLPTPV